MDSEGFQQSVVSDKEYFESQREISNQDDSPYAGDGWIRSRVFRKIPLVVKIVEDYQIDYQGPLFTYLPDQIKEIFNHKKVLVTGHGSGKIAAYMAVAESGRFKNEGRTGVLAIEGIPVTLKVKGKEFLVEIKGVGGPGGGYSYDSRRKIHGGLDPALGHNEYKQMIWNQTENPYFDPATGVQLIAAYSFTLNSIRHSYILRLVPSTIRASFRNRDSMKVGSDQDKQIAFSFAKIWSSFILQGKIPVSHLENLIVIGNYQKFTMTDFADLLDLGLFPYRKETPKSAIYSSLRAISQLPGYNHRMHFPFFKNGVLEALKQTGESSSLLLAVESAENIREITDSLWKNKLALSFFRQRQKNGYLSSEMGNLELNSNELEESYFENLINDFYIRTRNIEQNIQYQTDKIRRLKQSLSSIEADVFMYQYDLVELEKQFNSSEKFAMQAQLKTTIEKAKVKEKDYQEQIDFTEAMEEGYKAQLNWIQRTQKSHQSLIELLTSKDFTKSWQNSHLDPQGLHAHKAIDFGEAGRIFQAAIRHLKKEIDYLQDAQKIASDEIKEEIQTSLNYAQEQLDYLTQNNPYATFLAIVTQPEKIFEFFMIPYSSKTLTINPFFLEEDQYKKYAKQVSELIEKKSQ